MSYLTTSQIAERHNVSVRTIMRMVKGGELPYVEKLAGGTGPYIFDPAVVEAAFRDRARPREPAA